MEVSSDFVDGVPSSYVTTLLGLVSLGLMDLEIIAFVLSVPIPMRRFQCRGLQMAYFLRNIQTVRVAIIKWNKIRKMLNMFLNL